MIFDLLNDICLYIIFVKGDSDAIGLEPTSSSNSVKVVSVVWLEVTKVRDHRNIVIDDDINCWNIDSSSKDIC